MVRLLFAHSPCEGSRRKARPSAVRWNVTQPTRLEQDHRGITQRSYPTRGFGSVAGAARFCTAHDELRDHLRGRRRQGEAVPLAEQRRISLERLAEVHALLAA